MVALAVGERLAFAIGAALAFFGAGRAGECLQFIKVLERGHRVWRAPADMHVLAAFRARRTIVRAERAC